ncbi:hypothetical protein EXN66_Car011751 [Channa argus]|uniref:Uncharacterized protein n=1 Tax=Channa argus TaxID=215402 RepID=A0A6G1Q0M6_CHAAH|nr:hypothetical protein EXN66_Car011751 [Channa argus]
MINNSISIILTIVLYYLYKQNFYVFPRGKAPVGIPRQLNALTLYRCEQSVLDYCHAHLSLHLNVGMESPTQALGQRPDRAEKHTDITRITGELETVDWCIGATK